MEIGEAFYNLGDHGTYLPTQHTEGPWSRQFQHGGPPTALLARAIEQCLAGDPGLARGQGLAQDQRTAGEQVRIGRMSFDILAPVPMLPLRTTAEVSRPGRRVRRVEATLTAGNAAVITASAWAILPAPVDLPVDTVPVEAFPPPDGLPPSDPATHPEWKCGFLAATEWRFVYGCYGTPGPAAAWVRPKVALLAGEPLSPVQRVALTADSANGVSAVLDISAWMFVPPELTLHLLRPPAGEWLCLAAQSLVRPGTIGLATATLHDRNGPVARSAQSLLVRRHSARG